MEKLEDKQCVERDAATWQVFYRLAARFEATLWQRGAVWRGELQGYHVELVQTQALF